MEEKNENILEDKKDTVEDIPSSENSDLRVFEDNYEALIQQTEYINQKMDNITNILIFCMIGVGIVVGIICCNIFSQYFKS